MTTTGAFGAGGLLRVATPPNSKVYTAMPLILNYILSCPPRLPIMLLHLDKTDGCDLADDNESMSMTAFRLFLLHSYNDAS